ncbi:uncharacterized protein LOC116344765 [Contarinia nasturtii]|uniref:uncharacterized protein LOC116344765 n=1 Tax=Contarinia nasturtii TaxID=265458 RepID=UPI0012D48C3E|nr:uncharacterized protein LOC116344765 [Contarinia nasturtii]XP_031629360.1 uncharacterized protein LOC116344765 [Contarinia nasturtii]
MNKMKIDFEIPIDIKNDLIYCQRALANHILIHQKLVSMMKTADVRLGASLKSLQKDILDIGDEQRLLFNRLRFFIDYHQITKGASIAEREKLTNQVREDLANHSRANPGDIRPMNVQIRPNEDALYGKYFQSTTSPEDGYSSGNSASNDVKIEPISSSSDDEKIEILALSNDVRVDQKVYSGPKQKATKAPAAGQTLLKPIHQRLIAEADAENPICVVRPEVGLKKTVPPQDQPLSISLGRLRLAQALSAQLNTAQPAQKIESPKTVSPQTTPKENCNTRLSSLSSSRSSNGSSVEIEPMKDEEDAQELSQEGFLRLFGLYTPAYTQYLMNRRPSRKTRQCKSTERGDYLYGKYELFEKQFANKRQRQFLYSPPATRAKRRVGSNGTTKNTAKEPCCIPKRNRGIKSNASSSSSISSNGSNNSSEKVCLTCYKRNNLLQCQKCCGQYHAACHNMNTEIVIRRTFCPFCVRQKGRHKNF